jgi:glycosyltransferase involved in cell wall biosynthesis
MILIDARFINKKNIRGIGNYSFGFLQAFRGRLPNSEIYILLSGKPLDNVHQFCINLRINIISLFSRNYIVEELIEIPFLINKYSFKKYIGLGNTLPIIRSSKVDYFISLHDLMFFNHEENLNRRSFYSKLVDSYRKHNFKLYVDSINVKIIAVSEYTKNDVKKLGYDNERVVVGYQGLNIDVAVEFKSSESQDYENYFVCFGALDSRKNTKKIIQAFLRYRVSRNNSCKLIVLGLDVEQVQKFDLGDDIFINCGIIATGYITDEEKNNYLIKAKGLVFASLYEGFGIPILEAFNCGCPVIVSNVTSLPEIAGSAAIYIDPNDILSLVSAFSKLDNIDYRKDLITKGRDRLSLFQWDKLIFNYISVIYD